MNHGYAVVVQDVRGRYRSGGKFEPINQEVNDGDDTLNWIARQPWSDGGVGMYGGSYLGIAQWKAALTQNPHLKAIFPYVSGDDDYRDRFYSTGRRDEARPSPALARGKHARAADYVPPDFKSYVSTLPVRSGGSRRHRALVWTLGDTGGGPSLLRRVLEGHQCAGASERHPHSRSIRSAAGMTITSRAISTRSRFSASAIRSDRIMIGPWAHVFSATFPEREFRERFAGSAAAGQSEMVRSLAEGQRRARSREHPVRIFVMGINRWRDEDEWPLARAHKEKFYLERRTVELGEQARPHAAADTFRLRSAQSRAHDGRRRVLRSAQFSRGARWTSARSRSAAMCSCIRTAPLASDTEVTGPDQGGALCVVERARYGLHRETGGRFPGRAARNLTDGILRARYRDSLETPKLMTPGEVYRMTIDAGVTSNVFRAGHRIRLEISSSNFPALRPQSEYRALVADEREVRKATQTVYHDHDRHSYVLLPVVPAAPAELTSSRQARMFQRERVLRWRGSQVVRPGSAKPLFVGSIPTRASSINSFKINQFTTSTL